MKRQEIIISFSCTHRSNIMSATRCLCRWRPYTLQRQSPTVSREYEQEKMNTYIINLRITLNRTFCNLFK